MSDRFWDKVRKTDTCWHWTGSTDENGYGKIGRGRRGSGPILAHRASYEINVGPIPEEMGVLHSCDTPSCVRPDHLFLGDQLTNMQDCSAKGRSTRGEKASNAKVTEEQVTEMREKYAAGGRSYSSLAREYGISRQNLADIINRRRWKHVT